MSAIIDNVAEQVYIIYKSLEVVIQAASYVMLLVIDKLIEVV
ncbi:hypothetical protein [Sporocytophaga myxococcoides]|nr:hypothetical protein [Sporocytophaga myxococcoides]